MAPHLYVPACTSPLRLSDEESSSLVSLMEGGNSAVDCCWERECYDSNYTEANEIFFQADWLYRMLRCSEELILS